LAILRGGWKIFKRVKKSYAIISMKLKQLFLAALLLPGALFAADTMQQIPLWPNGAPGFESRKDIPEQAHDYWVRNINNPSVTVFLPPKEKANGTAVLICPGGGHRELVFNAEGVDPARYLNSLGIAAFALKYRLARETNSPYSLQIHPRQDAQRAMRLIRSRAAEWNIDTNRIGIMGFSAGGEVVSMLVYSATDGNTNAVDPVERLTCRPDFQIVIYPGPLDVPKMVPTNTPPAFFLAANDDHSPSVVITTLLEKFREAKVPAEVHLYAQGGHAFNMGNRSKLASIHDWPQRMADWLADSGFLKPAPSPAK
jgi:acetyl esterase/lipase